MSLRKTLLILMLAISTATTVVALNAQDTKSDVGRRTVSKIQPSYPEIARKMNLTGTVKVAIVIAPNGSVKDAKLTGGHPVLGNAALDAVKKWRFEPASVESSGTVTFKFENNQ
ncbi:MAG: energy transducer TonB [Candidatus Sulfotelmatobacter sp.]